MKVSVIIPVYNRSENFRALFICLTRQTIQPYEVIISDDGSSQDILRSINDLIENAHFKIKYIYQKDKGFRKARALNNAVKNAEGELLVFCDQDLIFSSKHIEEIINQSRKNEFLMGRVFFTNEIEKNSILKYIETTDYENLKEVNNSEKEKKLKKIVKKDKIRRIIKKFHLNKRGIKLAGGTYSIFKQDYIKVNGYDEKFQGWGYEDDDFGNRLNAYKIYGREMYSSVMQGHLFHPTASTKIENEYINKEYYYSRREMIFKNKEIRCTYGYDNSLDDDKVEIKIIEKTNKLNN